MTIHTARKAPGSWALKGGNLSGGRAPKAGHKGPAPTFASIGPKKPTNTKLDKV